MYPEKVVRHTLGLALLVTIVVLALSACSGGGQEQANKPRRLPEDEKPLHAGEYRTKEFKPSLSFRVGKGWSTESHPPDVPERVGLTWRQEGTANFFFFNLQHVFEPDDAGYEYVVEAPKDMVGWFQHHPYLRTDKPKPVTVGGVKGVQFDVVPEVPEKYVGSYCRGIAMATDCVDIAPYKRGTARGLVAWEEGVKERVIVLEDVKGETVVIDFGAPPGKKFDEFKAESQKVVNSVKWIGSQERPGFIHPGAWKVNSANFALTEF